MPAQVGPQEPGLASAGGVPAVEQQSAGRTNQFVAAPTLAVAILARMRSFASVSTRSPANLQFWLRTSSPERLPVAGEGWTHVGLKTCCQLVWPVRKASSGSGSATAVTMYAVSFPLVELLGTAVATAIVAAESRQQAAATAITGTAAIACTQPAVNFCARGAARAIFYLPISPAAL